MCTNRILYQPGNVELNLKKSSRKGTKMSLKEIVFMTDCLRMLGNRLNMPIVEVSSLLSRKGVYPQFHEMIESQPELSKVQVTNRLQKLIAAR